MKLPSQERGVALIAALIFLVVGTLLALSTLSGNVSEEKMIRNNMQRQVAFEAAEIALLAGEAYVEEDTNLVDEWVFHSADGVSDNDVSANNIGDQCVNGFCTPVRRGLDFDPSDPANDRWLDTTLGVWGDTSKHRLVDVAGQTDLDLPERPKYIIEFLRYVPAEEADGSIGRTACDFSDPFGTQNGTEKQWSVWPYCVDDMKEYRITAVGYAGIDSEVRVMLQSTYIAD